jgi:hypothetical protein
MSRPDAEALDGLNRPGKLARIDKVNDKGNGVRRTQNESF